MVSASAKIQHVRGLNRMPCQHLATLTKLEDYNRSGSIYDVSGNICIHSWIIDSLAVYCPSPAHQCRSSNYCSSQYSSLLIKLRDTIWCGCTPLRSTLLLTWCMDLIFVSFLSLWLRLKVYQILQSAIPRYNSWIIRPILVSSHTIVIHHAIKDKHLPRTIPLSGETRVRRLSVGSHCTLLRPTYNPKRCIYLDKIWFVAPLA